MPNRGLAQLLSFLVCAGLMAAPAQAQERILPDGYCQYAGEPLPDDLYGFESPAEAVEAVRRIVRYTGLEANFQIRAANVPNAAAVIQGQTRLLLYNQAFMAEVKNQIDPQWAAISIMAHEVGHHLQGHTIQAGGSRPQIELEADKYSGYVLRRMGATLAQARAAMERLGSDSGSSTHPARSARLAAITNGWMLADELSQNKRPATTPDPQPASQVPLPQPQTPTQNGGGPAGGANSSNNPGSQFVARVVFPGDPVSYYVTVGDDIVGLPPGGVATLVGKRLPPAYPGFVWMYSTPVITYGVTADGKVMSRSPFGVAYPVGYVTAP